MSRDFYGMRDDDRKSELAISVFFELQNGKRTCPTPPCLLFVSNKPDS